MARSAKKHAPAPADQITEEELLAVLTDRERLSFMRKQAREQEAKVDNAETSLMTRLKEGAVCVGKLSATIETSEGACRPAWRALFIEHMGEVHKMGDKTAEELARSKYPAKPVDQLVIGQGGAASR